ncbi:MAG: Holliday junction branch migration protein RuvA [Microgenomates group bacterium]
MISKLTGIPEYFGDHILLTVSGVGYDIFVTTDAMSLAKNAIDKKIPNDKISLFTYLWVREDALELYGFASPEELKIFKYLLQVSGVGPKTALSITNYGVSKIVGAVQSGNVAFFKSVPRVGKRSAQKIIIELTPKLGALEDLDLTPLSHTHSDVYEALLSLGYDEQTVHALVRTLDIDKLGVTGAIQAAIKSLSKS